MGMAYDVFGTGKTAFKVSLNRYVAGPVAARELRRQPLSNYQTRRARTWTDDNHNFYPDCDFGESGCAEPHRHGRRHLRGVHRRQRELRPVGADLGERPRRRTSGSTIAATTGSSRRASSRSSCRSGWRSTSAFFRRWYGNFTITDNFNVTTVRLQPVQRRRCRTIRAAAERPDDQRLPGINPDKSRRSRPTTTSGFRATTANKRALAGVRLQYERAAGRAAR